MKKILATALALVFILALTIPGFADGDTVVTMDVYDVAQPEDCEWTLTIPSGFSIGFGDLIIKYQKEMFNEDGSITTNVGENSQFELEVSGLPREYQISINTTHTPLSSPDTDTVLHYGICNIGTGNGNNNTLGSSVSVTEGDELSIVVSNRNSLTGISGLLSKRIGGLKINDVEEIGALKAGSYSSIITFTSALEPMS